MVLLLMSDLAFIWVGAQPCHENLMMRICSSVIDYFCTKQRGCWQLDSRSEAIRLLGISMDRFQEMQVFAAVAQDQGFSAAARRLGLSAASVTRAVAALEKRIGTPLLTRTTRSVHLSEAGQRYLEDCRRILAEVQEAEDSAAGSHAQPRGQLTITAPVLFGELFVTPLIVDFLTQFPDVTINALLVDRVVNVVEEGIDVAVRIGELPDSNQHAIRVGEVRRVVCVSPAFLAVHGRPSHPQELAQRPVIATSATGQLRSWPFLEGGEPISVRTDPRLVVTANQAAITAACLGLGYTRVLSYQVANKVAAGDLEIVLANFEMPPLPIHVVYQGGRKAAARIRSFVDFTVKALREHPALQV
jgi:DNA-binding transcriptional LysR family regulator